MAFMDFFYEQMYILLSIYYYEGFIYKNNIQVKRVIQECSFSNDFFVDFKGKKCWLLVKENCFVKGHKIIAHFNEDFCIQLKATEEKYIKEINNSLIKTDTVVKLSAKVTKEDKEKSKNKKFITESNMPPTLLFEKFNAHFVVKALAKPKTTDWTIVALGITAGIIIIVFILAIVFGVFTK